MASVASDQRPPRRVRRRLDPERRREQLLDAAEAVCRGRDPREVTFEQVAEVAGVSRALLYNYFGDKPGLLAAMYVRWAVELDGAVVAAIIEDAPAEERLRAVIRAHLELATRHGDVVAQVLATGAYDHPTVDQARRCRVDRVAEAWGPTADDRVVAAGVLALLERMAVDRLAEPPVAPQRAEDLAFALLWPGLSTAPHSPFAST